jgi:hypothetical protein
MKEIYIKKLFYYNRIGYPVEIKHNANLSWAIPKRSTVFATLSENITDQKILENCFKLKYKGILVTHDEDLEHAILENITYEDFYVNILKDPIFLIEEKKITNTIIVDEKKDVLKTKKSKSKDFE